VKRQVSVQCVVANGCIRMVFGILAVERFRGICVGIVRTGFHTDGFEPSANPLFFIVNGFESLVVSLFLFL